MNYLLYHVKLEGRLSISVLRKRSSLYIKLEPKTDAFPKSSQTFKSRHAPSFGALPA